MSDTATIEDVILQALAGIQSIKLVGSMGRDEMPSKPAEWPAAFACFIGDTDNSPLPRPQPVMDFSIYLFNKNLRSGNKTDRDIYGLIDTVRDMFNGKRLGLKDIKPFEVISRRMVDYDDGDVWYEIKMRTRNILPAITPD